MRCVIDADVARTNIHEACAGCKQIAEKIYKFYIEVLVK